MRIQSLVFIYDMLKSERNRLENEIRSHYPCLNDVSEDSYLAYLKECQDDVDSVLLDLETLDLSF